ncbi:MAG: lysine 2,3-aminomutase [Chitinophagales bacterium]|nr:lysine 2,3-aminomutase [Chitinophagales bacterium]MCB9022728.1 lysine 2,3-aminomutase [Chitinophagales bacterium]
MPEINYKAYSLHNFRSIPEMKLLSEEELFDIEVVGHVLPFKVNNYVIDELIDWTDYRHDAMFRLTFPQKDMLSKTHFDKMAAAMRKTSDKQELKAVANEIRLELNPHPAGQMELNVPMLDDIKLTGIQHKYRQTVLFFPSSGQTCHSYCTFCFRWPQFVGMDELKFAMRETELLIQYLEEHQEATDLLFTGGDPMVMSYKVFSSFIEPILADTNKTNIQTIRIGTKSLAYWPYKFLTDKDADQFIDLFERIVQKGINLAFMAHFNHPQELQTEAVARAVERIRATGAQIRTQSPLLNNINADPDIWAEMWRKQVNMNMIPYYMFIARDTGAQRYFEVPIVDAWHIFRKAYQQVSGVCRTVRGPSMSCTPGKVQVLGVNEMPLNGKMEKVITLRMIQGRNPDWVARPFFAKYDPNAKWMNDLKPAFGDTFFFEQELEQMYHEKVDQGEHANFE